MKVAGLGGVVFASGLPGCASYGQTGGQQDFYFVQLSDVHWGYDNAKVNPEAKGTLQQGDRGGEQRSRRSPTSWSSRAISRRRPTTRRCGASGSASSASSAAELKVPKVYYFAGEHDAVARPRRGLPGGDRRPAALHLRPQGHPLHRARQHLRPGADPRREADRVAQGRSRAAASPTTPIVVLTHRPLFPLLPQWDWATRDGRRRSTR